MSIARCPHCGTANRAGANYCNGCGTDLRGADRLPPAAQPSEPDPGRPPPPPASDVSASPVEEQPNPAGENPPLGDQPWLRLEFEDDEPPDESAEGPAPESEERGRLVTGVQGLLAPIRIATNIGDRDPILATVTAADEPPAEEQRMVRGLMAETPALVNYQVPSALAGAPSWRVGWIAALVLLAIGLPALLRFDGLPGAPNRWPGVDAAFMAVQALGPDDPILILWGYDPATAGELDLAMAPVMRHLFARRTRPTVVSLLPGGMASAWRLVARLRAAPGAGGLAQTAQLGRPVTYAFVPGGPAILPLLARDPAAAGVPLADDPPALVIVAAAQAEDVQQWLEQVQPLAPSPVVAVTSAGADPILRPYLASGQLTGIVSGFDGAYAYQTRLDPFIAPEDMPSLVQQVRLQNWGHLAILAVIALGNLVALTGSGRASGLVQD